MTLRFLSSSLLALLLSLNAHAVDMRLPMGGGAPGWTPGFRIAEPNEVSALSAFLNTPDAASVLAKYSALDAGRTLNPDSEADRALVGALALPAGDKLTADMVAQAYESARQNLTKSLHEHALDTLSGVARGESGANHILSADKDLARTIRQFSIFRPALSEEAREVKRLAGEIRLGRPIFLAESIARRLNGSSRPDFDPPLAKEAPARSFLAPAPTPALGIDKSAMDPSVRPQADFFRYTNGTWLKNFSMPADKARYGVFDKLDDEAREAVKKIIEEAASAASPTPEQKQIADLYQSYMNEKAIETAGLRPIAYELVKITRIKSKRELPEIFARWEAQGFSQPIGLYVDQDAKEPTRYAAQIQQGGLGLPDRDYYFKKGLQWRKNRTAYIAYLTKLMELSGEKEPEKKAQTVFALEKALAKYHWTIVRNRDVNKTYNKTPIAKLGALAPGIDWTRYLREAGVRSEETDVIISQPSYLAGLAKEIKRQPLSTWRLYLKARALDGSASYLPERFAQAAFDFRGRALSGKQEMEPRWKRAVNLANGALGETVGKFYVEKRFPEASKKLALELVENLRGAVIDRINQASWMSAETKEKALVKARAFTPKIGYPDRFRDYAKLALRPDDLLGNVRRANHFEYQRMMKKLGSSLDRGEWLMTPQTINAYYSPVMNEIAFPAAILQAPFFDPSVDAAVNYGAIGAVIGHEDSHAYDDQGAEYDADGTLRNWWKPEDKAAFQAQTKKLVELYNSFQPLPGLNIKGEQTLGENLGDLGGLTFAYYAYRRSLGGKEAPIIDGFTGDQRFFLAFAQVWRTAIREQKLRDQVANDYHSPAEFRVNGTLRNMPEFYRAFGVKEGDPLFLPEDKRAKIW